MMSPEEKQTVSEGLSGFEKEYFLKIAPTPRPRNSKSSDPKPPSNKSKGTDLSLFGDIQQFLSKNAIVLIREAHDSRWSEELKILKERAANCPIEVWLRLCDSTQIQACLKEWRYEVDVMNYRESRTLQRILELEKVIQGITFNKKLEENKADRERAQMAFEEYQLKLKTLEVQSEGLVQKSRDDLNISTALSHWRENREGSTQESIQAQQDRKNKQVLESLLTETVAEKLKGARAGLLRSKLNGSDREVAYSLKLIHDLEQELVLEEARKAQEALDPEEKGLLVRSPVRQKPG